MPLLTELGVGLVLWLKICRAYGAFLRPLDRLFVNLNRFLIWGVPKLSYVMWKRNFYDSTTSGGRLPTLFTKEKSEDEQAAESRHFQIALSG